MFPSLSLCLYPVQAPPPGIAPVLLQSPQLPILTDCQLDLAAVLALPGLGALLPVSSTQGCCRSHPVAPTRARGGRSSEQWLVRGAAHPPPALAGPLARQQPARLQGPPHRQPAHGGHPGGKGMHV